MGGQRKLSQQKRSRPASAKYGQTKVFKRPKIEMNAYYMPDFKEQEQLYKEGISLKQERNVYQQENLKLRTKVAMLENDLKRKITLVNQLSIQPS